jgi:putative DNA primase/helicase
MIDDGLIQRFQLLVWPDFAGEWRYVDRAPDEAAQRRAAEVYRRLVGLDSGTPARLRFDSVAQRMFIEWLTGLEMRLTSGDTSPALQAHLAKYRKLMPALALLFSLADERLGAVPLESAKRAAGWCEFLEPHARRIYSENPAPGMCAARILARKLRDGALGAGGSFTLRDVYRPQWLGLKSSDEARAALRVLCEHAWVRPAQARDRAGRPSENYQIHPRIREAD